MAETAGVGGSGEGLTVEETVGEGLGIAAARRASALERLARAALLPTERPARRMALDSAQGLIGFWVLWQLEGGLEGLERLGLPRSTVYRKVKAFIESFGEHPDTFQFPGLAADPEAYLRVFGPDDGEQVAMPRVIALGRTGPARLPRPRD